MLSLAGKFFTSLPVSAETSLQQQWSYFLPRFTSLPVPSIKRAETSLQQQWSYFLSGSFKVTPLEEDLILFDFKKEEDTKKVLEKGPWNVDGVIWVLKQYPLDLDISDNDEFSVACFWVKAEGLPLYYYTLKDYKKKIAKKLSDKPLISSEIDKSQKAFWVRVKVNLRQPLKAGFFLRGKRRPHYVQFKYKNIGKFCEVCGKIDHTSCYSIPKERALTRKLWTRTYGPWVSYNYGLMVRNSSSSSSVKFKYDFSEKKPISEMMMYEEAEAVLLVEFKIDVVYSSKHEWLGKALTRSFLDKDVRHCFRLPLSLLIAKTITSSTMVYEILSSEIEEMTPSVGLRSTEKDSVIRKLKVKRVF
ncbi:hypothetical protein V5N11_012045 [Cardamine amara subsp. amara]|uniref:DUF4283 domain-containing protein n=1 Tax=Cardamine amara subsp. amara TaxID=228776 RepID=A0ABD0ZU97_CARAN